MNNAEELVIGEKTWRNLTHPVEKDGYREGHENGRQECFQSGFDQGFKEGFEDAFKMAYQNGILSVSEKFGFPPSKDETIIASPFPSPWQGNCETCRSHYKN